MSRRSAGNPEGGGEGAPALGSFGFLGLLLTPGSLARQTAGLSGAAAAGQALLLLSTPLLTRLYPPGDFALYAVYAALVAVVGVVAAGRLEMAVALPQEDSAGAALARLAVGASLLTGALAALVLGLVGPALVRILDAPALAPWLLPAAASIALAGATQGLSYWWLRRGAAGRVAGSRAVQVAGLVSGQLALGAFWGGGPRGLVLGMVLGQAVGLAVLLPGALRPVILGGAAAGTSARELLDRYRGMPLNALQTAFLNALAKNLFPLVFLRTLGALATGLVTFAERLLTAPVGMLTQALWQVTHTRLGSLGRERRRALLLRIHGALAFALAWPLALVAVFADLAGRVFGAQWAELAGLLPWFAAMVYLNGVSNATSYFLAFEQYRAEVAFNVSLVVARLLALLFGLLYLGPMAAILLYAAVSALFYLALNLWWGRFLGTLPRFLAHLVTGAGLALGAAVLCKGAAAASPWLGAGAVAAASVVAGALVLRRWRGPAPGSALA